MIPVLLKILPDDFNDDSQLNEDLSMIHHLNISSEHFVNSENISHLANRNALLPNFYPNNELNNRSQTNLSIKCNIRGSVQEKINNLGCMSMANCGQNISSSLLKVNET